MRLVVLFVVALFVSSPARTLSVLDTEPRQFPYVVARVNWGNRTSFYFKMTPSPKEPGNREAGFGFCYKAVLGESDRLIWKTEGWYSSSVFLTESGSCLVRLGEWPRGQEPEAADLAVAFYKEGVLIKSYSTTDLIKDVSKVEPSVSHYRFLADSSIPDFARTQDGGVSDGLFELTTVDGIHYVFRVNDGSILSATPE